MSKQIRLMIYSDGLEVERINKEIIALRLRRYELKSRIRKNMRIEKK